MHGNLKQMAGEHAAIFVRHGMVVGLGTGSTVAFTIKRLGRAVKEGLDIIGIPTSVESEELAKSLGIRLSSLEEHPEIDLTIDGADEVDPNFNLIKGMGGALLREKIVAKASKTEIIVADESKMVDVLGVKTPVPVEVVRFGWSVTKIKLERLDCVAVFRKKGEAPYITDNGNYILDCKFESIENPYELEKELNNIPGVVENGLFLDIAKKVILGKPTGVEELNRR
jgi:ribose 5-phosphate isomerase A